MVYEMTSSPQSDIREILYACRQGRLATDLLHDRSVVESETAVTHVMTIIEGSLILLDLLIEYPELLPPVQLFDTGEDWFKITGQSRTDFQVVNLQTQEESQVSKFHVTQFQHTTI